MNFENIIGNPPYEKIGVDITNFILKQIPYNNISLLGTTAMLSKHNDVLALEYVYIEDYTLSPVTKCKWVGQIILLGHKGKCDVIASSYYVGRRKKEQKPNELRFQFGQQQSGKNQGTILSKTTRNRDTSSILSLSDEDYEYIKKHWDGMSYIERFWWLMDKGLYKKYVVQSDNQ